MAGALPRHIAVIMDGNGRWATQRGLPREKGHEAGAESVRQIVRTCGRLGVEVLTLYSFSTENWRRPHSEVEALMALLEHYLRTEQEELMDNDVRLRAIGDVARLPQHVRTMLTFVEAATADNDGMLLQLALSYGGRAEITRAVRAVAEKVAAGSLRAADISEADIEAHLYTGGLPDPDLLIRTSGELRLSNFLLWQLAYAELFVTDVLWPDFRDEHLMTAISAYGGRERRFGKTGAQVAAT